MFRSWLSFSSTLKSCITFLRVVVLLRVILIAFRISLRRLILVVSVRVSTFVLSVIFIYKVSK